MLFQPTILSSLWDTWLYYQDGTHYLFYLSSTRLDRPWDGIGMAVSRDGVHFEDLGEVIHKAPDAQYLGAGHTWRTNDRYVLNFSECRNGTLEIFFAESDDLLTWRRISADESVSRLDPRWYADGTEFSDQRWDNIWAIPDASGSGFFGYVTAVAKEGPIGLRGTCASVTSPDGRVFTTGAPVIEPGVWGDKLEIGGAERIGEHYYMFAAQAEIPLGLRWSAHHPQAAGGVYVLRADHQEGPFQLDPRQPPVLVSSPQHYTYFSRFYRAGDEMLSCHHAITPVRDIVNVFPKPGSFLAPLKSVHVEDGILSFRWWNGNEALKGAKLSATFDDANVRGASASVQGDSSGARFGANAGAQWAFAENFDLEQGAVIEFTTSVHPHNDRPGGVGLVIGHGGRWAGTAMVADTAGGFEIGDYNGYAFRAADTKRIADAAGRRARWRVLVRSTLVEVYLDDAFVQAYTLPQASNGRLSLLAEAADVSVSGLELWAMTL